MIVLLLLWNNLGHGKPWNFKSFKDFEPCNSVINSHCFSYKFAFQRQILWPTRIVTVVQRIVMQCTYHDHFLPWNFNDRALIKIISYCDLWSVVTGGCFINERIFWIHWESRQSQWGKIHIVLLCLVPIKSML